MNNETTQLAEYLGQMIRQATVETIRHTVGEDAATRAANNMRAIPLPGGDTEPAAPVWPSAPYVWWEGDVLRRGGDFYASAAWKLGSDGLTGEGVYGDNVRSFAREAVPVTLVPTEAWEFWKQACASELYAPSRGIDGGLIAAVDRLTQEVNR